MAMVSVTMGDHFSTSSLMNDIGVTFMSSSFKNKMKRKDMDIILHQDHRNGLQT